MLRTLLVCSTLVALVHIRPAHASVTIIGDAYGLVLDVSAAGTGDGVPVVEWSDDQGLNQQWNLVHRGDGTYNIVNVNSGKCLDVTDGSTDNGALLQQWTCWGGENQAWDLNRTPSGTYEIIGVGSNKCIDAPLDITTPGVRPQIWECHGRSNQQWHFPVSPTPAPTPTPATNIPDNFTYNIGATRGSQVPVFVRPNMYDYAPALMFENGIWRMWWCASVDYAGGDHIFHAEATSLDGPWHAHGSNQADTADDVFQPTYNPADWDGQDTCDPSVLHVGDTYYLYYGGFPIANTPPTGVTAIGVAVSGDGLQFNRVRSTPIITPARSIDGLPNPYGAGQPAAIYLNNQYYLAYTDTTGVGSDGPGATSGAGIFVLRSGDPTFGSNVEELGAQGFAPWNWSTHTQTPIIKAYTVDWAYSDAHKRFFMLWNDSNNGLTRIYVFDAQLSALQSDLSFGGASFDGPGIAALPNKHLPTGNACNTVDLDALRAVSDGTGNGPYSWDLAHAGVTLDASFSCLHAAR